MFPDHLNEIVGPFSLLVLESKVLQKVRGQVHEGSDTTWLKLLEPS